MSKRYSVHSYVVKDLSNGDIAPRSFGDHGTANESWKEPTYAGSSWKVMEERIHVVGKQRKMLGEKTWAKQWKLYGVRSSGNWEEMDHPRRRECIRKWAKRPGCFVREGISRITFQSVGLGWHLTGKGHKVTKDHRWHSRSFEDSEGWCHVGGNRSCLEPESWIEWADVRAGSQ